MPDVTQHEALSVGVDRNGIRDHAATLTDPAELRQFIEALGYELVRARRMLHEERDAGAND